MTKDMFSSSKFYDRYYKLSGDKKKWNISNDEFNEYLKHDNNEIDFLWHSITFNLFSKTIYNFSPENYKYCNDYILWKYGHYNFMNKIYKKELKKFIDTNCKKAPHELRDKFYNYSIKEMDNYCIIFYSLIYLFSNECCDFNYNNIINKAIKNYSFREEFSEKENDLSNIFFKTLISQI